MEGRDFFDSVKLYNRFTRSAFRIIHTYKVSRLSKIWCLIIGIIFIVFLVWNYKAMNFCHTLNKNLTSNVHMNAAELSRNPDVSKTLKHILIWTGHDYSPLVFLGNGQTAFIKNNCSYHDCYVTRSRRFFDGDLTKFDAIAFNGRTLNPRDVPKVRSPHQKYMFFNLESPENHPVCSKVFDGFFNWTATYKLNSDIIYPYMRIRNKDGDIVGPRVDMEWLVDYDNANEDITERIVNKTKAVAWFVSNCNRAKRMSLVQGLQKSLTPYGYTVDIYGQCGNMKCPISSKLDCDLMLNRDYYFYMSLENSFAEDYVTEKVFNAVQLDVVPIVYGGADYTRFLPPGSYLDANLMKTEDLALIINNLIKSPMKYMAYFNWKKHYKYSDPTRTENVCAVCAALNTRKVFELTEYKEFRKWWHPEYESRCRLRTRWNNKHVKRKLKLS